MGVTELIKKWKRAVDNFVTYRRIVYITLTAMFIFLGIYPHFLAEDNNIHTFQMEKISQCIDESLWPLRSEIEEGNANLRYIITFADGLKDASYLPFIGNGYIGLTIAPVSNIYLKKLRTLALKVNWSPLYNVEIDKLHSEAVVSNFLSGVLHRFLCLGNSLHVTYEYLAHRTRPYLFMQEIKLVNPSSHPVDLKLIIPSLASWPAAKSKLIRLSEAKGKAQYQIISGVVERSDADLAVTIIIKSIPSKYVIEPHRTKLLQIPCIIYSETIKKGTFPNKKDSLERMSIEEMKNVSMDNFSKIKLEHINAWSRVWESGLSISHSKAANALNGDKINATIYYVLSNVLPFSANYTGNKSLSPLRLEQQNYLSLSESCYGGYQHTLHAKNLWRNLNTLEDINDSVSLWLLTLEKQGCQKLINTGYTGVMQAMILSFGGFKFTGHHLEFKIDPKFLHRDFLFRRLCYDGFTNINISVTLQDDNKAVLGVSLDKNDKTYYACGGGCMEEPVKLSNSVISFPVKVTEPITSILYITSDKSHMEAIKHTHHVTKIKEAPAYDHLVIALHRHGHHLGGLPVLFWASICFLIIIFHLFLFKLIFNEYCDKQDKHRVRYGKI